jgi:hypothetical protein
VQGRRGGVAVGGGVDDVRALVGGAEPEAAARGRQSRRGARTCMRRRSGLAPASRSCTPAAAATTTSRDSVRLLSLDA